MWVLMDQAMTAKAVGVHRIAVFTPQKTTAKISFACCDWPEDFTTRFAIPEAECPYCGTQESFAGYSSLFFEKEAMANYSGFPALQNCANDPSAPIAPTTAQCPDETPQGSGASPTTQPESCKLGCVGGECHSHNIFGACTYAMEWITPMPMLYNTNVTKMILFKGDTIMFSSASHFWPHNLVSMPSAQHLASCDWTGAVQVLTVEEVRTGTAVSFPEAGTFYYSCQMTGHCEMGQKLVVEVKDSSEGMRCHDHGGENKTANQQAQPAPTANVSCPSGEVHAYVLESKVYGATAGQCSQMCTSAAGIPWITGAKQGMCADEGFVQMVKDISVKPAGSPMDMQVKIMSKNDASGTQCPSGEVTAYLLESADYGAKAGECSQVCTSSAAIQWMTGAKQGKCADVGFTHMVEAKSVKPAGSPMDVTVKIMGRKQADSCHCHSYEEISCAVSDALYDEHITEIREHCASILDGSENVCPYKCFQPFEVLHLHYLECTDRVVHSLYSAVKETGKCHMAAQAPYGSDCAAVNVSRAAPANHTMPTATSTDMPTSAPSARMSTSTDVPTAMPTTLISASSSAPPNTDDVSVSDNTNYKSASMISVVALAFATGMTMP
jgi:hypothetical protein